MEQENEIQELKERLANVESQIQQKSHFSTVLKFALGFIIVFVFLLILIGIFQFINTSDSFS
jgi:cytochrome c biogenesis protein CcdA